MAAKTATDGPDLTTPRGIIEAADASIVEADARAAQLEADARNGVESVTADDLAEAKRQSEWARIRRDAAGKKAAARAQEIREEEYAALLEKNLPVATADVAAEIAALLDQARPLVEQAMHIARDRNRAVWRIASYVSDVRNHRDPQHGLSGYAPAQLPGAATFDYQGKEYTYLPATDVFRDLLRPLKQDAKVLSGGMFAEWLDEI